MRWASSPSTGVANAVVGVSPAAVAVPGDPAASVGRDPIGLWTWPAWAAVGAATLGVAVAIVLGTGMTPSFDAYGWLTWGDQVWHGTLDLQAAPSFKPLTFAFTILYVPLSASAAPTLWSVTAVAGALSTAVFAYRIAYRLVRDDLAVGRRGALSPAVAATGGGLFAGVGALGLREMGHLAFIANSDPLNTALVLAAIDAHLSRRPRLAYLALVCAALGRPEAWPLVGLYGLWLHRRVPGAGALAVAGWLAVLAGWALPSALAGASPLQAGTLNLGRATAIEGNKLFGVALRCANLYEWPMQVAASIGVAIAVVGRDRRVLGLCAVAGAWLLVEVGFAYHGFSAVYRYVMEAAAVMVVVAGVAVGQLLGGLPALPGGRRTPRAAVVVGPLVVLGILVALVPVAHRRALQTREALPAVRDFGLVVAALHRAVDRAGGRTAIRACGAVAAQGPYQSQVAWAMGLNVSDVLVDPPRLLRTRRPIVLFIRTGAHTWHVRSYHVPGALGERCARTTAVTTS